MRKKTYLAYLAIQIMVILAVTILFKVIQDRQLAAMVAGSLFLVVPILLMSFEYHQSEFDEILWYVGVLQFWTLFALPIFSMRVLNWGVPFDQLSFLGIPGAVLHNWSSKSYLVMMLMTLRSWWKSKVPPDQSKSV